MSNKSIVFKDIDIVSLLELSDSFIKDELSESLSLHSDLLNEDVTLDVTIPSYTDEDFNNVKKFIADYFVLKYNDIQYPEFDKEYKYDLYKIFKLYEIEMKIEREITKINDYFTNNNKFSLEDINSLFSINENLTYIIEKESDRNKKILLDNYNNKAESFSKKYKDVNHFSDNDLLNIKYILSSIDKNPTYLANFNKFNNNLFNTFVSNDSNLHNSSLIDSYEKKINESIEFESNIDISDVLNTEMIINLCLYKYLNYEYENNSIINNHNNNLRELILKKISDGLYENKDIPEISNRFVFSNKNLDDLFKNIDVFNDKFLVTFNTKNKY